MKTCSKCKEDKPLSLFYKDKKTNTGHRASCKSCTNVVIMSYSKTVKGKEARRVAVSKWANTDKGRAAGKISRQKYVSSNKGKVLMNAHNAARRAMKLRSGLSGYKVELKLIYKNCPKGYHVDHIIPLKNDLVCGLHVPWNLQYLTAKENLRKGNSFSL